MSVFGENDSRCLSKFLKTHTFWKFDHTSRTYNQINYRNIWFAKVIVIRLMTVQKLFLMPFPKKTHTLMPLSKCRLKILIFCLIVVFIHLQNTLIPISCVFHIHFLLSNLRTFVFYNKYLLCKRFHFFFLLFTFPKHLFR